MKCWKERVEMRQSETQCKSLANLLVLKLFSYPNECYILDLDDFG